MKKFLTKLSVMVTFWCVTAVLLISIIIVSTRPISYDWQYKGGVDLFGAGGKQDVKLLFDDEDELKIFVEMDNMSFDMGMWYVRNARKYSPVGISYVPAMVQEYIGFETMTEIEFEEEVRLTKADRQQWNSIWSTADSVNAYKCVLDGEVFLCTSAIVFTVVNGVLCLATLTFSILSTVVFVKEKKNKGSENNTTEEKAD